MKFILHIGMAKTGTTSIQKTFSRLQSPGVAYLPWPSINHLPWFQQQFGDEDRPTVLERRRAQFAALEAFLTERKPPVLVVSSEHLSVQDSDPPIKRLRDYIASLGADVEVLAYIRRPAAFFQSGYQQMLKARIISELKLENALPFYRKGLERYDRIFGRDRVKFKLFDHSLLYNGDVVADFANEIGVTLATGDVIHENESLSLEAAALLYVHRHFGEVASAHPRATPKQANAFVALLRRIGTTRFAFSQALMAPYLERAADDIAWMEGRLGQSLRDEAQADGLHIGALDDLLDVAEAARPLLLEAVTARLSSAASGQAYLTEAKALLGRGGTAELARALDAIRLSLD